MRALYGGSGNDVLVAIAADGDLKPLTGSFTAYPTFTGGTPITDLLTAASAVASTVTPDSRGRVMFYGPDAYTGSVWLQGTAGGLRWLVNPSDLASRGVGPPSAGAYSAGLYGVGNYSGGSPPQNPPGRVTNLAVTGTTLDTVSLAWTAPSGATSYRVAETNFDTSITVTPTTYTATGLQANTTYLFTVYAVNATGSSSGVSISATTVLAAPQPPVITSLTVT